MSMQDLGLRLPGQECRDTDGIYGAVIKQEVLADTVTDLSCACRASVKARKLCEVARPPADRQTESDWDNAYQRSDILKSVSEKLPLNSNRMGYRKQLRGLGLKETVKSCCLMSG